MMSPLKFLGPPVIVGSMALFTSRIVRAEVDEKFPRRCESPSDVYDVPPLKPNGRPDATELERTINKCRQEFQPIKLGVSDAIAKATCFIRESTSIVRENIDYLRNAPQEVQVGAIAAGVLAGTMLGIRRSIWKKLWYASLGGVGMTALIYPKESKVVAKEGYKMAKCYGIVAYNFILGRQM